MDGGSVVNPSDVCFTLSSVVTAGTVVCGASVLGGFVVSGIWIVVSTGSLVSGLFVDIVVSGLTVVSGNIYNAFNSKFLLFNFYCLKKVFY